MKTPSAWYGAWYVAELLNILTQNPDLWKKTIFILTYDENDGYFDHVPPFVAPDPRRKHGAPAQKAQPGSEKASAFPAALRDNYRQGGHAWITRPCRGMRTRREP